MFTCVTQQLLFPVLSGKYYDALKNLPWGLMTPEIWAACQ